MCTIFATKIAHLAWTKTFWQKIHCAKFKEILTADPELWQCTFFGSKIAHLSQTNFFWKFITIILIYLLAPLIVQNLKKVLPADPELWGCSNYWGQNGPFPQIIIFSENLFMSLVCFIRAYLHTKNLKVKY